MLMSVVFPAPLGPRSAKISPWPMSRSTAFSALRPDLYVLVSREMEMMGDIPASLAAEDAFPTLAAALSPTLSPALPQGGGRILLVKSRMESTSPLAAEVARRR